MQNRSKIKRQPLNTLLPLSLWIKDQSPFHISLAAAADLSVITYQEKNRWVSCGSLKIFVLIHKVAKLSQHRKIFDINNFFVIFLRFLEIARHLESPARLTQVIASCHAGAAVNHFLHVFRQPQVSRANTLQ